MYSQNFTEFSLKFNQTVPEILANCSQNFTKFFSTFFTKFSTKLHPFSSKMSLNFCHKFHRIFPKSSLHFPKFHQIFLKLPKNFPQNINFFLKFFWRFHQYNIKISPNCSQNSTELGSKLHQIFLKVVYQIFHKTSSILFQNFSLNENQYILQISSIIFQNFTKWLHKYEKWSCLEFREPSHFWNIVTYPRNWHRALWVVSV